MRTICDVCESAPPSSSARRTRPPSANPVTIRSRINKVVMVSLCSIVLKLKMHLLWNLHLVLEHCNKLASRHVRVGLAIPSDVPLCDISFFYCEIDGSSLCLQCDTVVHVGGKQTHKRYLLLRQRVEFPMDKANNSEGLALQTLVLMRRGRSRRCQIFDQRKLQNHRLTTIPHVETMKDECRNINAEMIDLNARPLHAQGQPSSTQARGMHVIEGTSHHNGTVIHIGSFKGGPEK
ncbi:unnamed protein product [Spirodela intermedia]|uniref:Uncharacterized protein n=1 Tax=Spirodela intermedia TaxID=51605 RepID=A0A7I8IF02_SPIIN|nr:unnamed protein product [Spirodela intermedia]CAA6656377.1 unnamed protein product [Spirodela intermedia]